MDSESSDDEVADADKEEFAEMRSRPQFEIDVIRGDATLSFTCSFIQDTQPIQEGDGYSKFIITFKTILIIFQIFKNIGFFR